MEDKITVDDPWLIPEGKYQGQYRWVNYEPYDADSYFFLEKMVGESWERVQYPEDVQVCRAWVFYYEK